VFKVKTTSTKWHGKKTVIIFIDWEILPGPGDARICFLTTARDFSEIQKSILLMMIICEILLFIRFFFWGGIKIHHGWDRSFNEEKLVYVLIKNTNVYPSKSITMLLL